MNERVKVRGESLPRMNGVANLKAQDEAVALEERKLILVQRKLESLRLLDALLERIKVKYCIQYT